MEGQYGIYISIYLPSTSPCGLFPPAEAFYLSNSTNLHDHIYISIYLPGSSLCGLFHSQTVKRSFYLSNSTCLWTYLSINLPVPSTNPCGLFPSFYLSNYIDLILPIQGYINLFFYLRTQYQSMWSVPLFLSI